MSFQPINTVCVVISITLWLFFAIVIGMLSLEFEDSLATCAIVASLFATALNHAAIKFARKAQTALTTKPGILDRFLYEFLCIRASQSILSKISTVMRRLTNGRIDLAPTTSNCELLALTTIAWLAFAASAVCSSKPLLLIAAGSFLFL
jgi:hypothetical protein